MLKRLLICGFLLFGAATIDLGLPVWSSAPVLPSFVTLLLVLFCQSLRGGELVFWAGASGLFLDYATGQPPGVATLSAATIALIMATFPEVSGTERHFLDRLLTGVGILLVLGTIRALQIMVSGTDVPLQQILGTILNRSAATFLMLTLVLGLMAIWRLCWRPSYRLENPCL